MKKKIFFLVGIMMVSSIGFSAEKKSLESNLSTIESQFNELMRKEDAQKQKLYSTKGSIGSWSGRLESKTNKQRKNW